MEANMRRNEWHTHRTPDGSIDYRYYECRARSERTGAIAATPAFVVRLCRELIAFWNLPPMGRVSRARFRA